MALRSRSRTRSATSGPGRGPTSDGRARTRPGTGPHPRSRPGSAPARRRSRHRHAPAEELRRRAEILFAEHAGKRREPGTHADEGAAEADLHGAAEPRYGVDRRAGAASESDVDLHAAVGPRSGVDRRAGTGSQSGVDRRAGTGSQSGVDRRAGTGTEEVRAAGVDADVGADSPRASGTWRERVGPALRERMPVWLQSRCGLERGNVVALTVLLVVAAGFAVQHFWTGRTQSVRAPEVVRATAAYGERVPGGRTDPAASAGASNTAGTDGRAATADGPGAAGGEIVVDVSGKVRSPGIHRLPAGSRVVDALRAAGGVRPGTSTDGLNRARFLVDGEQVVVGGPAPAAAAGTGAGGTAAGGPGGGAPPGAPVSLNTATVDQLDTLPGVGPVLARHILDYRARHGGFRSVDELREVNGIGERRFADLRDLVRP
ncbi:helix-hairpin-helix domain-containing protein [Streptomyces sp. NPDC059582]|uniref:helix-hairpin-helix domain-containing protein n=1 Tax=Streptomyces sp. NPDC059582 TaxID=3346875 RepID=UPI0036B318ED